MQDDDEENVKGKGKGGGCQSTYWQDEAGTWWWEDPATAMRYYSYTGEGMDWHAVDIVC